MTESYKFLVKKTRMTRHPATEKGLTICLAIFTCA